MITNNRKKRKKRKERKGEFYNLASERKKGRPASFHGSNAKEN